MTDLVRVTQDKRSRAKPFNDWAVLHLKDLNRHLECTDLSFNPENCTFSTIKKQADTQTDKVTTVTLSRMRAEG